MTRLNTDEKKLTGRHVLIALLTFFGVIIAINAYFITAAVKSFRGEDVKRSYRQGLDYNQRILARAEEQSLGWVVKGNLVEKNPPELVFSISDQTGDPIYDAVITGVLRHPTDLALDIPVEFKPGAKGVYRTKIAIEPGTWRFVGKVVKNDQALSFQYDIVLDQ